MLVFVDESGDPGMKLDKGSSPFFVITTVVFRDRSEAQKCDDGISALRAELKLSPKKEFHFNKDGDAIRDAFFGCIAKYSFSYSAIVLNKGRVTGPGFQFKDSLYKYTVRLAFENIFHQLCGATIVFDRCGGREFNQQLKNYLRKRINEKAGNSDHGKVKKVKDESSATNNLLQMVDMVCGAVSRCYSSQHPGRARYRTMIRKRENTVQVWPRL